MKSLMLFLPKTRLFWSVGIGHLTNDIFTSMGVVVLTFLSVSLLPMSNTQIGLAVSLAQLTGALSQPFFGLQADKTGGRWLGAGGVAWLVGMMMLAIALASITRLYALVIVPYVLAGFGSGAFHPVGSLQSAESDKTRVARNVAFFFLMGQMGLALGPLLAGVLLDVANTHWLSPYALSSLSVTKPTLHNVSPLFLLGVMAVPSMVFMVRTIPLRHKDTTNPTPPFQWRSLPFGALGILAVMVIFRGIAQPGSVNFFPLLFQQKGWSPSEYGFITSSFWISAGIAGVVVGDLADRFERRKIMMVTMALSAPMFFFLPLTDGVLAVTLAMLAGGLSGGTHSMLVVLAQELLPGGKGLASGAMLGFIFATGALGSLVIGAVSDSIGLSATFQFVGASALVSGGLALLLPMGKRR